jgi:predicted Zn-dependent protease
MNLLAYSVILKENTQLERRPPLLLSVSLVQHLSGDFNMLPERLRRPAVLCCLALLMVCGERPGVCRQTGQTSAQENSQPLAEAATAAREAGNADEAIRDYNRALALRPDWAEGWWYLGTMQYDRDRYAEAIPALQKLVGLAPGLGAGWSFLGLSEFETKDYADALDHLQKAQSVGVADDPELARVSAYHLALLLNRGGEFEKASALLLSTAGQGQLPAQIKTALGMALLRIPLLPDEVNPSQDALIQRAGEAAAMAGQSANYLDALKALVSEHAKTPWLHYAYGMALAAAEQTNEALAAQREEAAISPRSALPHRAMAKTLEAMGRKQEAAEETRAAERLASEKALADFDAALFYRMPSERGVGSEARPADNTDAWNQAMAAYSAGHYQEAIAALKTWVERKPSDGTAWAVMGLSEYELGDYDNALIHLERGQQLGVGAGPQAIQLARYRLASLLVRKGQFERATELLGPLAGQPPLAHEIEFALGLALLRIPSLPSGVEASRQSLVQGAGEVAELLLASKYDQAFPRLQRLIEQYPRARFLHYADGIALDSLSQYDEAKAQMRAEIAISPRSALPWTRLASITLRQHLPGEALPAAQTAVQLAPDAADAHYVLGRAYADLGDTAKAIQELESASRLSPESPEIHFALARVYAKADQLEKAAQERAAFARLNALAEQQRAQNGDQSYRGPHDAANSSILGTQTGTQPGSQSSAPAAAQPQ